eukprot:scaffold36305_cov35-Cyclotella_meneghiniana.AAC.9
MVSLYHVAAMYFIDMNLIAIFCISLHSNGDNLCNGQYSESARPSSMPSSQPSCEKCTGWLACYQLDQSNIGCGSCIGGMACHGLSADVIIGAESCQGDYACAYGQGEWNIVWL